MFEWSTENISCYTAHVPGKLFVAGEYAILEPGNPAILFAVDQYLSCMVTESNTPNEIRLTTELLELTPLQFSRDSTLPTDSDWRYVLAAIDVVEQFIQESQRPLKSYHLHFATELIDEHGAKYGFGSSGAVTVATIKALLCFYGVRNSSPSLLFKLAAIALVNINTTGSLADIAVNCYGGWIYYQSLDRIWLKEQLQTHHSLTTLLSSEWHSLRIEPLNAPDNLRIHIGWTTSPASTDRQVHSFTAQKNQQPTIYQQLVHDSAEVVERMKYAFDQQDLELFQQSVRDARQLLLMLDNAYQLDIETPALKQLIAIAEQHDCVAKSSGAGGGDCGIAFGTSTRSHEALRNAWRQAGIIPLSLGIAPSQTINE